MRDAHLLCHYSMSLSAFRKLWAINVRRVLSYNFTYCAIKANQKFCNFPYGSETGRKCISVLNEISCAVSILRSQLLFATSAVQKSQRHSSLALLMVFPQGKYWVIQSRNSGCMPPSLLQLEGAVSIPHSSLAARCTLQGRK